MTDAERVERLLRSALVPVEPPGALRRPLRAAARRTRRGCGRRAGRLGSRRRCATRATGRAPRPPSVVGGSLAERHSARARPPAAPQARRRRPEGSSSAVGASPRTSRSARASGLPVRGTGREVADPHRPGSRRTGDRGGGHPQSRGRGGYAARPGRRPARIRAALRPPRRRGLLARYRMVGNRVTAEDITAGGLPVDLAQPAALRPGPRKRAHVGARHRAQPGDRCAPPKRRARPPAETIEGIEERPRGARAYRRGGGRREEARTIRTLWTRSRGAAQDDRARLLRGLFHSQIAELLDEPIGTVKGRMRLGLDKMRRQLSEGFAAGGIRMTARPRPLQGGDRRLPAGGADRASSARGSSAIWPTARACRDEIEQLRPAADALPRSVEQVEPPPSAQGRADGGRRARGG